MTEEPNPRPALPDILLELVAAVRTLTGEIEQLRAEVRTLREGADRGGWFETEEGGAGAGGANGQSPDEAYDDPRDHVVECDVCHEFVLAEDMPAHLPRCLVAHGEAE